MIRNVKLSLILFKIKLSFIINYEDDECIEKTLQITNLLGWLERVYTY